jgi:hypothetical protein
MTTNITADHQPCSKRLFPAITATSPCSPASRRANRPLLSPSTQVINTG